MRRGWSGRRAGLAVAAAALTLGPAAWAAGPAGAAPTPHRAAVAHAAYPSPITDNFWLVTPSGGVEPYGVPSFGAPSGPLNQPIVATAADHTRNGYWLVAADGGVFAYGDTAFYGSTGNLVLNQPIVGMAQTPDDRGYWLVAADGGIFSFGDAAFYGSTGNLVLNQPVVGMSHTSDGLGYWLVAADGGVFTFGDARFFGSAAGTAPEPVQDIVDGPSDGGYWIVQQNGTAEAFGSAVGATLPSEALLMKPITPGDRATLFAFQQLGKPYIWGGNGPVGYDCSGLALASWQHGAGIGFARVANDQYHTAGTPVGLSDLEAGDLVFWGNNTSDWTTVYHTAIYVGGNRIVESTGDHVQLNTIDQWSMTDIMPNGRRP